MIKLIKIFLIFFLFISFSNAENINNFEPKSNFWLYFIALTFFIGITFHFYTKTKYIERNKKNFFFSVIILISLGFSFLLDLNFQKNQILNLKNEEKKGTTSIKIKFNSEKARRKLLQIELEKQTSKFKLLEEKIENSKKIEKDTFSTNENILKSNEIQTNIKRLQQDLINIDKSINKVNSGDFSENLVEEYSISQKLKNRKRLRELELEKAKTNTKTDIFSINIEDEEDDFFGIENEKSLSKKEKQDYKKELENYKKELAKSKRKIILVKGKKAETKKTLSPESSLLGVEKGAVKQSSEEKFFRNHYNSIVKKELKKAYENSAKKTSFEKYKNWYKDVKKIVVNKVYLKKNTKNNYFIDLEIYDKNGLKNYLVLKELIKLKNGKFKIKTSKTIKITPLEKKEENKKINKKINIKSIKNIELKNILKTKNKKYLLLDARENIERKAGYIDGSVFIRFADLINGGYDKLDKKKIIVVYTWEKTKSIEVAEFLKTKGFDVRFLENGVSGWIKEKGNYKGEKDVFKVYKKPRYKYKFSKNILEKKYKNGIYLIDVRKKEVFDNSHLKGSFNIPLVYLSKNKWAESIKQIPKDVEIVTICDNNLTCFYAQVVGIEMEKVGYKFMGYYNLLTK